MSAKVDQNLEGYWEQAYWKVVPKLQAAIVDCLNSRAPSSTTPDPSWTEDAEGYVVAPLENRGTLDAG